MDSVICQGHSCEAMTWTPSTDTQSPPPTEICCGSHLREHLTCPPASLWNLSQKAPSQGHPNSRLGDQSQTRGLREEDDRKVLAHRVNEWALGAPGIRLWSCVTLGKALLSLFPALTWWPLGMPEGQHGLQNSRDRAGAMAALRM